MKPTLMLFQNRDHPLWTRVDPSLSIGKFVIADPMDPQHLLYLTPRKYEEYSKVALSNDMTLQVLLRPEDKYVISPDGDRPASFRNASDVARDTDGHNTRSIKDVDSPTNHKPHSASIYDFDPMVDEERPIDDVITIEDLYSGSYDPNKAFKFCKVDTSPSAIMKKFSISNSLRNYSLKGDLTWFSRPDNNPTFLGLGLNSFSPILRRWATTISLRLTGSALSPAYLDATLSMNKFLEKLLRTQGDEVVLKYMKNSSSFVLSYLSGHPSQSGYTYGIPVRLASGLPKFIPSCIRRDLRRGDTFAYRFVFSYLASHKALFGGHVLPTLDSISSTPWDKDGLKEISLAIPRFIQDWSQDYKVRVPSLDILTDPPLSEATTVGPNFGISSVGAGLDALAWLVTGCLPKLFKWFELTNSTTLKRTFEITLKEASGSVIGLDGSSDARFGRVLIRTTKPGTFRSLWTSQLALGKLSLKPEAAGKTRVFAIVDYWTQTIFGPLHDRLFSFLKGSPCDATFDQSAALETFVNKEFLEVLCFDLTSATDMIPLEIQTEILSVLIGRETADLWADILVGRDFKVPPKKTSYPKSLIRYTRGQPMGALSSWAMLALTHHFLVFLAAHRLGIHHFEDYVVCGDDIAIGSKEVGVSYYDLCCELGIPISLPKSTKSSAFHPRPRNFKLKGSLVNFVSRTVLGSTDLSALSLKDEISVRNLESRSQSVFRLISRGVLTMTPNWMAQILRAGLCRVSDSKVINMALSSGRMTDQIRDYLASLLFPTPQSTAVLGLKGEVFVPWMTSIIKAPWIITTGFDNLKNPTIRVPFPKMEFYLALADSFESTLKRRRDDLIADLNVFAEFRTVLYNSSPRLSGRFRVWGFDATPTLTCALVEATVLKNSATMDRLEYEINHLLKNVRNQTDYPDDLRSNAVVQLIEKISSLPTPLRLRFLKKAPRDEVLLTDLGPEGGSIRGPLFELKESYRSRPTPITPRVIRRYVDDKISVLDVPGDQDDGSPRTLEFISGYDWAIPQLESRNPTKLTTWLDRAISSSEVKLDCSPGVPVCYVDLPSLLEAVSLGSDLKDLSSHFVMTDSRILFEVMNKSLEIEAQDILDRVAVFTSEKWVDDPFRELTTAAKIRYSLSPHQAAFNTVYDAVKKFLKGTGEGAHQTS